MDINELREKWQEFLSASISAKYGNSEKDTKEMIDKLEEFDKFWEVFKNEQSRNREGNSRETDKPGV
jgi:hypothetical protein